MMRASQLDAGADAPETNQGGSGKDRKLRRAREGAKEAEASLAVTRVESERWKEKGKELAEAWNRERIALARDWSEPPVEWNVPRPCQKLWEPVTPPQFWRFPPPRHVRGPDSSRVDCGGSCWAHWNG